MTLHELDIHVFVFENWLFAVVYIYWNDLRVFCLWNYGEINKMTTLIDQVSRILLWIRHSPLLKGGSLEITLTVPLNNEVQSSAKVFIFISTSFSILSRSWKQKLTTVIGAYINTTKTTSDLNFDLYQAAKQLIFVYL